MSFSHSVTYRSTYNDGTVRQYEYTDTNTAGTELRISESIPDSAPDTQVTCDIDVSELKSLFIHSTGALLVETNNGTTPDDEFVLAANKPVVWSKGIKWEGSPNPMLGNPFSGVDITDLFCTNTSGAAVTLTLIALIDNTP